MRKIMLSLMFLPLFCFGQIPQTNLDFRWVSGYEISGDTLLVDSLTGSGDTRYVITFCADELTNITNGFISAKNICRINGQPVNTIFQDSAYLSQTFFEMAEREIYPNLFEQLPYRLESVSYYTTSISGADSTYYYDNWNIPAYSSTALEVGSGKTHPTYTAAVAAASINDTIYGYGSTDETTFLDITKALTLMAVAPSTITSSGTGAVVVIRQPNTIIEGFSFDGEDNTGFIFSNASAAATSIRYERNYITGWTNNVFNNGTTNSIYKRLVFDELNTTSVIDHTGDPYTTTITECFFNTQSTNATIYQPVANDTSTITVTYNRFKLEPTQSIITNAANLDFKYNFIEADTINTSMITYLTNTVRKNQNFTGNYFDINKYGQSFAYINNTQGIYDFDIQYDTLRTNSGGGVNFNFIEAASVNNGFSIINNDFDIYNGNAIKLDNITAGNEITISSNLIKSRTATDNDNWFTISLTSMPEDMILEGNKILNPGYFGQSFGGHACIFIDGAINAINRYNYTLGAGVSSQVYKNDGGNNTTAIYQSNITDGLLLKGQRKTKIYNNAIVDLGDNFRTSSYGLRIMENQDPGATDKRADSNRIFNNIIQGFDTAFVISNENSLAGNTFSNNNIFYDFVDFMSYNGTDRDLSWWQTNFNQDTNSFQTNPNFRSSTQLWPTPESDAIGNGVHMDSIYTLLDTTTVWTDGVVLDTASYFPDIGAYQTRSFDGDTIILGTDVKFSQWTSKINAGVEYVDKTESVELKTDSFQNGWVPKINDFIQLFTPIENDTIIYGTDDFRIWSEKVNKAIDYVQP